MAQGIATNKGKIKIIPTDTIKIYQVKESELDELERGSQSDLFLEFAIALISIAVSFFTSVLTATFPEGSKTFSVFVIIISVAIVSGVACLILWYRQRRSKKSIIQRIRAHEKDSDE